MKKNKKVARGRQEERLLEMRNENKDESRGTGTCASLVPPQSSEHRALVKAPTEIIRLYQTLHFPKVIIKRDCLAHGSSARWGLSMSKMSASAKLW